MRDSAWQIHVCMCSCVCVRVCLFAAELTRQHKSRTLDDHSGFRCCSCEGFSLFFFFLLAFMFVTEQKIGKKSIYIHVY